MSPSNEDFIAQVTALVAETEQTPLLVDRRADGLSGLSGLKSVGLLQRLARRFEDDPTACYLEIGVFQGLTLVSSALAAPGFPCYGIDNFATLDPEEVNLSIVRERMARFEVTNAHLINEDFEIALETLGDRLDGRRVAVYFIDGPHDYRSQLICLLLIKPFLHENAVIVIDDANYPDVRWSTRDFLLGHPEFKLLFEAYSPAHPANMTQEQKSIHEAGWLDGAQVLVRDPEGLLSDLLPPINPHERTFYLNDWLTHRKRLIELAPEALDLADAVCSGADETDARQSLRERHQQLKEQFKGRHSDRNLFSAGLTEGRLNRPA
ncbi:class I SAM-dependent methyltransferase [Magnetospira thiophila]